MIDFDKFAHPPGKLKHEFNTPVAFFGFLLVISFVLLIYIGPLSGLTGFLARKDKEQASFAKSVSEIPKLDINYVWSGVGVGFDLLTYKDRQFVAFYDQDRYLTVGSRKLDSKSWVYQRLETQIGWDAHNYITLAIDDNDHIHVAGNMHNSPLTYFRTTRPLDVTSLVRINSMVGREEEQATYPKFFRGPNNEFLFTYRYRGSGSGVYYINTYNHKTQTWKRLLDAPLFGSTANTGSMSAYPYGPVQDKNGLYHIVWIWRNSPAAETNHDISYARSKDLVHWQNSKGETLTLPLTFENAEIVDPVPVGGGAINNNVKIGFDTQNRPIVSYHKYDANGNTQIYNARLENGKWVIYQTSNWSNRWDFSGIGSLQFLIEIGEVNVEADGGLSQKYLHWIEDSGIWRLNLDTLSVIGEYPPFNRVPSELRIVQSLYQCIEDSRSQGMSVFIVFEQGTTEKDANYFIRWEALETNRDRPRTCQSPIPPTLLQLYTIDDFPSLQLLDPDVNNDGAVTVGDTGVIANAFGAIPGDSRFNSEYDLNVDGAITAGDIGLVSNAFGTINWPPVNTENTPVNLAVDKNWQIYLTAEDQDPGQLPNITSTGLPSNAKFTTEDIIMPSAKKLKRGLFSWKPNASSKGQTFPVTFKADDGACGTSCPTKTLYLKVQ